MFMFVLFMTPVFALFFQYQRKEGGRGPRTDGEGNVGKEKEGLHDTGTQKEATGTGRTQRVVT